MLKEAETLLEFDRVREMVADEARFYLSREAVLASRPGRTVDEVELLQDETAEAVLLLRRVGDIGMSGMRDVRESLRRAMLGGVLSGIDLLILAELFTSMWTARAQVLTLEIEAPLLAETAKGIRDLRLVRGQIFEVLSDSGTVLDSATPRLAQLREKSRHSYRQSMRLLEHFTRRDEVKPALQSTVIASRSDRLVLEVKSSHRQFVPGIVHGVSASGQTAFIEPFQAVSSTNEWRKAAYEAEKEEERVLRGLSRMVAEHGEYALASIEAASKLDSIYARGRLSLKIGGFRAETDAEGDIGVVLVEARHPLLGDEVVPISLQLNEVQRGLVITGPNTGGKTVALKTLGLLALMHQAGIQIPAREGSTLPIFDTVFADIGDSQSIDRSVSTFSSHMERVIRILRRVQGHSLVLLDELGTGTDPEEGSAIARAILDRLAAKGAWLCVTTHHRAVAQFAAKHRNLRNASVILDTDTLLPNYRLVMDVPGQSYAMQVAARLGLETSILETAETMLDPTRVEAEALLKALQRDRDETRELQERLTAELAEVAHTRSDVESEKLKAMEDREREIASVQEALKREVQRVRRQLRRLMREARRDQAWEEARQSASTIGRTIGDASWMSQNDVEAKVRQSSQPAEDRSKFLVGDTVKVPTLGLSGKIVELDRSNRAVILAGSMRFEARPHMMELVERDEAGGGVDESSLRSQPRQEASTVVSMGELDIRGSRAHSVDSVVPQFIDRAFMDGLTAIRIIHGEGTGALREAVRDVLSRERHVERFRPAPQNEGGNGVTVADLE